MKVNSKFERRILQNPKVFIGSSSEALNIAKALELNLTADCQTYLWTCGIFSLSQSALEDLESKAKEYEYAVLVLAPDDDIKSRGEISFAPRDNVLFELGLFVGRLGRKRTFIVCDPKTVKIPSDWDGIGVAKFDWERANLKGESRAALSPASTEILDAIRSVPLVNESLSDIYPCYERVWGEDELYGILVGNSPNRSGVIVSHSETSWAWKLFPTILEWCCRRVPVTVFLSPASGGNKKRRQEIYRRTLLKNLGATLIETEDLRFNGFFLDVHDE
ncbi:unnamed protein product, partial [marine sediment metagenome]